MTHRMNINKLYDIAQKINLQLGRWLWEHGDDSRLECAQNATNDLLLHLKEFKKKPRHYMVDDEVSLNGVSPKPS